MSVKFFEAKNKSKFIGMKDNTGCIIKNGDTIKQQCYICGNMRVCRMHSVALWDYGHRSIQQRLMCESCIEAEEEGIL